MDSYAETFGSWQSSNCSGARLLAPVTDAFDATRVPAAAVVPFVATGAGLGQPKALAMAGVTQRTHNSITRPGTPPRGRHR